MERVQPRLRSSAVSAHRREAKRTKRSQTSPRKADQAKKARLPKEQWPAAWKDEYARFQAAVKDVAKRRAILQTWEADLWRQVAYQVSDCTRDLMQR